MQFSLDYLPSMFGIHLVFSLLIRHIGNFGCCSFLWIFSIYGFSPTIYYRKSFSDFDKISVCTRTCFHGPYFFSCTDALGTTLATHLDKPRVYIGCMKSGEVFSEP